MGTLTRIPPYDGTLRLYVDGTNGNDANSGVDGWGNAWKTMAKLRDALTAILCIEPNGLLIEAFLRNAFVAQDLWARIECSGTSRFYIGQHLDDFTVLRTGTVAAVGGEAGPPKHGLERLTLNVAPPLTGTEVGRTLLLTDPVSGTHRGSSTIWRVDTVNQQVWVSQLIGEYPAWVAASPAIAKVIEPSAYVDGQIVVHTAGVVAEQPWIGSTFQTSALIGLRSAGRIEIYGSCITLAGCLAQSTGGTWNRIIVQQGRKQNIGYRRYNASYVIPDAVAVDYGIIGGTPIPNECLGNGADEVRGWTAGDMNIFGGYFKTSISQDRQGSNISASRFYTPVLYCAGHNWIDATNYALSGTATGAAHDAQFGAWIKGSKFTLLDVPATGIPAIYHSHRGGGIRIGASDIEGENTGTSWNRYGFWVQRDGIILAEGGIPDTIKAKTTCLYMDGGVFEASTACTFAASFGAGPDIWAGPGTEILFVDNVTKSAVNSETAIQSGVDGQITAAGKKFTSASAIFTLAHVGRSIKISVTINAGNVGVHEITAFINANNVTLNNMAAPVNEGPGLTWGLVGTPRPILEVARGGRVSQADGKTFNVRKPEVEPAPGSTLQEWGKWGYGLAGEGFANIHEGAEVVLGTLVEAAGAANAAGIAAKIKNESKLIHKGGAVILGTAPLDLGGNAAAAWPATIVSDAGAGTPQGCRVIANVP